MIVEKKLVCIKEGKHLRRFGETSKIGLRTVQGVITNWKDIIFEEEMWLEKNSNSKKSKLTMTVNQKQQ